MRFISNIFQHMYFLWQGVTMWHVCSNWGMRLQVGPSFRRNVFGPLCNFSLQGVMNEILDSTGLTWRSNCDGENSQNRTEEAGGRRASARSGKAGSLPNCKHGEKTNTLRDGFWMNCSGTTCRNTGVCAHARTHNRPNPRLRELDARETQ